MAVKAPKKHVVIQELDDYIDHMERFRGRRPVRMTVKKSAIKELEKMAVLDSLGRYRGIELSEAEG